MQVFVDGSIVWAQQDSTKLSLAELKQISGLLVELAECRELNVVASEKESFYQNLVKKYDENEQLYEQQLANKNAEIEAVTPAWYDNFWTGSAITGLIISSIYFLTR